MDTKMPEFTVEEKRIGRLERQRDAKLNKLKKLLSEKIITNQPMDNFNWLLHKEHINIIQNSPKKFIIIEPPFHLEHTDVPFDQIIYYKNIVQQFSHHLDDIKNNKIKVIYMFNDAWGTVNKNEKHQEYSGELLALDLYNLLYDVNKKAGILQQSVFCTGTSLNNVVQHNDWPIVYYNEPFNRYFSIGEQLKIKSNTFKKHFLWLNRRTRTHKLYALHQANKLDLFKNCIYTFHDFENDETVHLHNLEKYTKNIDLSFLEHRTTPDILDKDYDLQYDKQGQNTLFNLKRYADKCCFEIVSEYMGSDQKVFLTEKIARSIVMGKPFVVIGDRGMIKELHRLGFKTFHTMWKENYDKLPTVKQRVDAVMDVMCDLRENENFDLTKGYDKHMMDILLHNQKHYFGAYKQSQLDALKEIVK